MAEKKGFWETLVMGFDTKLIEKQSGFEVRQVNAQQRVVESYTARESAERARIEAQLTAFRNQEREQLQHAYQMQTLQLQSERTLLEEQRHLVEARYAIPKAELEGRKQLLIAGCEFLDWQHEGQVRQTAYSLPPQEAQGYIEEWREVERALLERETIRQSRLIRPLENPMSPHSSALALPSAEWGTPVDSPISGVDRHSMGSSALTDEQIHKLARKAVDRFEVLPKERQRQAWKDWESGLRERFPTLVAEEIITEAVAMKKKP